VLLVDGAMVRRESGAGSAWHVTAIPDFVNAGFARAIATRCAAGGDRGGGPTGSTPEGAR
jgi:hypothetical protein